jgi:hypothetical protein
MNDLIANRCTMRRRHPVLRSYAAMLAEMRAANASAIRAACRAVVYRRGR